MKNSKNDKEKTDENDKHQISTCPHLHARDCKFYKTWQRAFKKIKIQLV